MSCRSESLLTRRPAIGMALVTVIVCLAAVTAAPAHASVCVPASPGPHGAWRNIDSSTGSITRIHVDTCVPERNCPSVGDGLGTCQTRFGTAVRLFGRCDHTDCDWGIRMTSTTGDGWMRATYQRDRATHSVRLRTYSLRASVYLRLLIHTDFAPADGRTDSKTDEWFHRG